MMESVMVTDAQGESQEDTQQQTQSTQQASQSIDKALDQHLWGFLQPCSAALTRIDFWKIDPRYTIGRNTEMNSVVLPGFKISNRHCLITWDGSESSTSSVIVQDLSSNGTFINGVKIGKNQTRILREGNEIAFGTCTPQPANDGIEDYRFVYRHTAAGPPTEGLYAYYDISIELGKGSFATVMKAVSRTTGEWFAVKMMHEIKNVRTNGEVQAGHGNSTRNAAFAREISIMERLKHPNICELKEVFFQENGAINLVLELVEGGDLLDYILSRGGLAEPDAKHITYQICHALAYIHKQGVAHRDLKPENILLTKDNPPIVKVADFGLAKVVDSLTMLKTMCGTPSYLAPEVVKQENQEGYDNVVDSWSVGVIVFSMLTNASPFLEDENQRDVRTRIAERKIDWSTLTNCGVSREAQDFIRQLLEEDPMRRMALSDGLQHPWLLSYEPFYAYVTTPGPNPITSIRLNDVSMLSSMAEVDNQGFGGQTNGLTREGSKTAPLQRRSHIISEAAEGNGNPLPEPSWEMVAHAASQEAAGPSNWNGAPGNKGANKRVHSELTPLPEEMADVESDAEMKGSSPLSSAGSASNKKGRSSDEDELPGKAGGVKAPRGRGKAAAAAAAAASSPAPTKIRAARNKAAPYKSAEGMSEDDAQPRRSSRHPQKIARHT